MTSRLSMVPMIPSMARIVSSLLSFSWLPLSSSPPPGMTILVKNSKFPFLWFTLHSIKSWSAAQNILPLARWPCLSGVTQLSSTRMSHSYLSCLCRGTTSLYVKFHIIPVKLPSIPATHLQAEVPKKVYPVIENWWRFGLTNLRVPPSFLDNSDPRS